MAEPSLVQFLEAFILTYAIETPILYLVLRRFLTVKKSAVLSLLLNAFSLPLVWFVIPALMPDRLLYVASAEGFAVSTEASLLRLVGISWRKAIPASVIMNMASFSLGLVYYSLA